MSLMGIIADLDVSVQLVYKSYFTMVYGTYYQKVTGVYKTTYNWEGTTLQKW